MLSAPHIGQTTSKQRFARRAAALAAAALCVGSAFGQAWGSRVQAERTLSTPAQADKPIKVRSANGGIALTKSDGAEVKIKATVYAENDERLKQIQVRAVRDGAGQLTIDVAWPDDKRRGSEGATFEIALPGASGFNLETSNGPIAAAGLSGPFVGETSNGPITVKGHTGAIKADTSNGAITIIGATEGVNADTSNGSVDVELAAGNPGPVKIDTSNGAVKLAVGPAFSGVLVAGTSNGSVTVPEGVQVLKKSKDSAKIRFGSGDAESVLDTSNGSIRIEKRG